MKKSLLLSAILATVLFAGNAFGVSFGPYAVKNETGSDLWMFARTIGMVGKSAYLHMGPKEKPYTLKEVTVRKIKFRAYQCQNMKPVQLELDYEVKGVKTYYLIVSIEGDKIVVKEEENKSWF